MSKIKGVDYELKTEVTQNSSPLPTHINVYTHTHTPANKSKPLHLLPKININLCS